jgi:hypothetical protein
MRVWHNILRTLGAITVWLLVVGHPAGAQTGNDGKPGSVLFYNIYVSNSLNTLASDTLVTITNAAVDRDINVHFYFVDAYTCQVADASLLLTRNQTARFRTSEIDPDIKGYIVAVAVDEEGRPTRHNALLGHVTVKQTLGATAIATHSYELGAVAFAKLNHLAPTLSPDGTTADLVFDGGSSGSSYEPLPAEVAIDSFESPATSDTRLIIYSPKSNFHGEGEFGGRLFILFYDDAENSYSAQVGLVCWLQARLTIIRNITVRIGPGRTGWARITGYRDTERIPLLGSIASADEFVGGHNLHHLSAFPSYTMTIPIFPPR